MQRRFSPLTESSCLIRTLCLNRSAFTRNTTTTTNAIARVIQYIANEARRGEVRQDETRRVSAVTAQPHHLPALHSETWSPTFGTNQQISTGITSNISHLMYFRVKFSSKLVWRKRKCLTCWGEKCSAFEKLRPHFSLIQVCSRILTFSDQSLALHGLNCSMSDH